MGIVYENTNGHVRDHIKVTNKTQNAITVTVSATMREADGDKK